MSHLDLDDTQAYRAWVDRKKAAYDRRADADFQLIFDIDHDGRIPAESLAGIRSQIEDYNFALYRAVNPQPDTLGLLKSIGAQMGLRELDKNLCAAEDRVTHLTVTDHGRAHQYIPYTNKAIGWHTDGYYNPWHQRVQALVLHCEQPAEEGGVNQILDPDMLYIHLRDIEPAYIRALSDPKVMCIPENIENGELIRPQTCSAVFIDEQDHALAMRYSRRQRNIIWADDAVTHEALDCLLQFLDADTPYHVEYRLNTGEGLICNNVLHTRSAFTDSAEHKRSYYRARYYNRINIPAQTLPGDNPEVSSHAMAK